MCLKLKKTSRLRTAKKDIPCYKVLTPTYHLNKSMIKHGDDFTGIIKNTPVEGKIAISNNNIYLCTNNSNADGAFIIDKFGFEFSWYLDIDVTSIIINGRECLKSILKTFYRNTPVKIGRTYTSKLIRNSYNEIHIGLHSFLHLDDAKKESIDIYVKCVIPKGATYYIGDYKNVKNYTSSKLKYVEIVK